MTTNFLISLFINSMVIFGLNIVLAPSQILGFLGDKIRDVPYWWLQKPLSECPPCMASFWGTLFFLAFTPCEWYMFPVYILALAGLNFVINQQL